MLIVVGGDADASLVRTFTGQSLDRQDGQYNGRTPQTYNHHHHYNYHSFHQTHDHDHHNHYNFHQKVWTNTMTDIIINVKAPPRPKRRSAFL